MSAHTRRNRSLSAFSPAVLLAVGLAGAIGVAAAAPVEYVPDRVMVRFAPGAAAAERANVRAAIGAELDVAYTIVPGLERLTLAPGRTVEEAVTALQRNPNVLYAEPDFVVRATITTPNDPSYADLWGMANIKAPTAWDTTTGNPATVVAIIDTGMDRSHPDLQDNIWTNPDETAGNGIDDDRNGYVDDVYGWDFAYNDNNPSDGNGHGTHTAGTVGARGNNGVGIVGVNWQVKLVALKFLSDSGSGATSNAVLAVQYAQKEGIRVSNNSWGGGGYSQSLYDAISAAKSIGHLFVAAAGNDNFNTDILPHYPSSYTLDNIISVASITSTDARSSFSNYGAVSVDLGAPGSSILSTVPGGYATYSGTSMATPHVAGAAAMLVGLHPTWTYGEIRDAILGTVRPISALAGKTVTGGTLDLAAAVNYQPGGSPPLAPSDLAGSALSSTEIRLTWTDNSGNETAFHVERASGGGEFATIRTLGVNVVTYTDSNLAASTQYTYRVYAANAAGDSAYSNTATVTTQAPPPLPPNPPSGLYATVVGKLVTLTWIDNATNESGFYVGRANYDTRKKTCGAYSVVKTVVADTTTTTDTRNSGSYCYKVQAYNAGGTSEWSNVQQVTISKTR